MKDENIKNILIVEDEKDSINIIGRMLKDYNLTFCDSEISLYLELSKKSFDIIIMDIGLPGSKNGLELIKELTTSTEYSSIPIICVTSHNYSSQKNIAMEAGAFAYITKPISKSIVMEMVNKALKITT